MFVYGGQGDERTAHKRFNMPAPFGRTCLVRPSSPTLDAMDLPVVGYLVVTGAAIALTLKALSQQ